MTKLQLKKELIGREGTWVNYRYEILKDEELAWYTPNYILDLWKFRRFKNVEKN